MGQKKLIRFKEINSFPNVLQYPQNMPGQWKHFFKNSKPIVLELGCGKGEYTVGLATMNVNRNYIGVDIKGNRLWAGAKRSLKEKIINAAFLRTQIDKIADYFGVEEVHEIWLTFPDPQLRTSKANKRLTHPKFLKLYSKILQPNAPIHLKTDSPELYKFTKSVINFYGLNLILDVDDLCNTQNVSQELKIITHYESLDIANSNRIFYLCFTLPKFLSADDKEFHNKLKKEEANYSETGIS